jgi:hypothetical protein
VSHWKTPWHLLNLLFLGSRTEQLRAGSEGLSFALFAWTNLQISTLELEFVLWHQITLFRLYIHHTRCYMTVLQIYNGCWWVNMLWTYSHGKNSSCVPAFSSALYKKKHDPKSCNFIPSHSTTALLKYTSLNPTRNVLNDCSQTALRTAHRFFPRNLRILSVTATYEPEGWRRLHNEELYALYSSPNTIKAIKSRKLRWIRHVARMVIEAVHTGFWCENLWGGNHLGDPGVGGRMILKWIFEKWDGWHGLDRSGSG